MPSCLCDKTLYACIDGRRIVELKQLAEDLWCYKCKIPLSLRFIKNENKFGLASILNVCCFMCQQNYEVLTNKFHLDEKYHRRFDINCKIAIAMIDAGIGESQINTVLSELNIPPVTTNLLKRHERVVGPVVEKIALESCREAIRIEKKLTLDDCLSNIGQSDNNNIILDPNTSPQDFCNLKNHNTLNNSDTPENLETCQVLNIVTNLNTISVHSNTSKDLIISENNCNSMHTSENVEISKAVGTFTNQNTTSVDSNTSIDLNTSENYCNSTDILENLEIVEAVDTATNPNTISVHSNTSNDLNISENSCNSMNTSENFETFKSLDTATNPYSTSVDSNTSINLNTSENNCNLMNTEALSVSIDTGWQTKGSGRSYNSKTGHSSVIGKYTGKIISYATRSTACRKCHAGHPKSSHDCRRNYDRSAKSMEPDMAVQLIVNNKLFQEENAKIKVLIGDDDSSTIAAVRRESVDNIEKWSDFNHALKSFKSSLYKLKLSQKVVEYLGYCFSCSIKKNMNEPTKVALALNNIVNHVYGEHGKCGDWCQYRELKGVYKHYKLPGNKPLSDLKLRAVLTELLAKFAKNAEKLAPCGSSQSNESFNNIVASKHPKSRHYGASESFDYRVASAVSQKNIGTSYVTRIHDDLSISPGKETIKFREKKDEVRQRKAEVARTLEFKKRRNHLKKEKTSTLAAKVRKEGISYESSCGLDDVSNIICDHSITREKVDFENSKIVIFDLETGGFGTSAEICQIAASYEDKNFNAYMIPSQGIMHKASDITGLRINGGSLFLKDQEVPTESTKKCFLDFISYLQNIGNKIILVAHNAFKFDAPIILQQMSKFGLLKEFMTAVQGITDTFYVFKNELKARKKEKKKFSLEALSKDYLDPSSIKGAHNAIYDVSMLKELINTLKISNSIIESHAKACSEIWQNLMTKPIIKRNRDSLENLSNGISKTMKGKLAAAGISMSVLQEAHKSGEDAVKQLLMGDVNGRPRVTKSERIISNILEALKSNKDPSISS